MLIQHSTSPCPHPLVGVPKQSGGICIPPVNCQKLNPGMKTANIAILRVNEVLDTLGGGSVWFFHDLFSVCRHFLGFTLHIFICLSLCTALLGPPRCLDADVRFRRQFACEVLGSFPALLHARTCFFFSSWCVFQTMSGLVLRRSST